MLFRTARTWAFVVVAGLAGACGSGGGGGQPSQPPTPPTAEASNGLTIVDDPSQVCMVYNTYMGRTQVMVEVGGAAYYSCCPACTDRLRGDASSRTAKDPVTGEVVDKAHAVIARTERNAVLYFASAQNVQRYQAPL